MIRLKYCWEGFDLITFDAEKKLFWLNTSGSTYVLHVYENGDLLELYAGAPIPCDDLRALATRPRCASFSPADARYADEHFSADTAPMAYATFGRGDFRPSAIAAENEDGNLVTELKYDSHRIYAGKPAPAGLPHLYTLADGDASTLEITLKDPYTGLTAILSYTVFEALDALTRSVRVVNGGDKPLILRRVMSLCADLPEMDYDLITLWGRHDKERNFDRRRLGHGEQGISSRRGSSSHAQNPFAALAKAGSDEDHGEVFGYNFIYSSNFAFTADCDYNSSTRILMGIEPTGLAIRLAPGEAFQAPEAVTVRSDEGLGGMSRTFHKLYNRHLIRGEWKEKKRPLLINSWEAAYFDFDTDKLVAFAERAKALGIEMLVMDDGWFGRRNDDTTSLGDWVVNTDKLPGGLKVLVDRVHALGLKFGIWFEPEMISPDSDLYRAHPDWCVHVPGRVNSVGRHQYVLDVSRADVRDALFSMICAVLDETPVDYVKWDFNRNISEAGSASLDSAHAGEFMHRFVLGTYDLQDRLTKRYPGLLLENCSGGGGRFDPGMLYYSPQIWTSDDTDAVERLSIQFGTSLCYPASAMGAHVSASSRTGYETKGDVALWGTFGYELDPVKLSAETQALVKEQVAEYHKYYDLIRRGDLYRLICPWDDVRVCAWSFVSEDKTQALATVVASLHRHHECWRLRFKGLDPAKTYRDEKTGETYSGAYLMRVGFNMCNKLHDGQSEKWYFTAE